jgi:hypothetical protein
MYDDELREAWNEFCERLKGAAELVFRPEAPKTELDAAWGIRYLSRYIARALDEELEFHDPLFPQLWILQRPTSKTFGDNPDCIYLVAMLEGSQTYRVTGNRGSVPWVRFNVRPTIGDSAFYDTASPQAQLGYDELETEWDGSFTVMIGPGPHPGNWLPTEPGPCRLVIRHFFGDWVEEELMKVRIERVGAEGEVPERLTADVMAAALRRANEFIERDSDRWFRWVQYYRSWPNTFIQGPPAFTEAGTRSQEELGRWLHFCYWHLEPDEALLVEFTPPPCFMWIYELNNSWMNSTDYRYHFSSLNSKQAVVEDDGSVRIAVCSEDPGIPNWLDPAGHGAGLLINRWIDSRENPTPGARVVKVRDLPRLLPADARLISPEERLEQKRRLKLGVDRRFGYSQ